MEIDCTVLDEKKKPDAEGSCDALGDPPRKSQIASAKTNAPVLPMAEMVGWLRQGVGELIRQAGLQMIELLMEEEVRQLAGERSQPQPERTANRWGKERRYCVVMGQKVPIERPRVRTTEDQEVRLGSYELFNRGEPLTETVWAKLMLGLSTRKYGRAVREFSEAYGVEKSAVSEHFIEASRAKLQDLMERRLDKIGLCALLIDATPFAGQQMVVVALIVCDSRLLLAELTTRPGAGIQTAAVRSPTPPAARATPGYDPAPADTGSSSATHSAARRLFVR